MWYWRKDNFVGLQQVAAHLATEPNLKHLSDYYSLRERGQRREAFASLEKFLIEAESWNVQQRREFVCWLMETHRANPKICDLIPHPLEKRLVLRTLAQWQREMPNDPAPFRLGWDIQSLRTAVLLDPMHQETVLRLATLLWQRVTMACHELPAGVIVETKIVLADLDEITKLLLSVVSPSQREWLAKVALYKRVVQNYELYLQDKSQSSFRAWANSRALESTVG